MVNPAMPASKTFQPQAPGTAETLPALYARWIEAIIQDSLPEEIEATCNDCVMCSRPGESVDTEQFFFDKRQQVLHLHPHSVQLHGRGHFR